LQFLVFGFKFQVFSSPTTIDEETSKTLAECPHRPRDEQEERTRWNQRALFGLRLRGFPEWLHSGGDKRREATPKHLTSTSGLSENVDAGK
jgi:hypothetical protein